MSEPVLRSEEDRTVMIRADVVAELLQFCALLPADGVRRETEPSAVLQQSIHGLLDSVDSATVVPKKRDFLHRRERRVLSSLRSTLKMLEKLKKVTDPADRALTESIDHLSEELSQRLSGNAPKNLRRSVGNGQELLQRSRHSNQILSAMEVVYRTAPERLYALWMFLKLHRALQARLTPAAHTEIKIGSSRNGALRLPKCFFVTYAEPTSGLFVRLTLGMGADYNSKLLLQMEKNQGRRKQRLTYLIRSDDKAANDPASVLQKNELSLIFTDPSRKNTDAPVCNIPVLPSERDGDWFEKLTLPFCPPDPPSGADFGTEPPSDASWTEQDVLIGTLRSHNQLEACLVHRFYFIPAELIPKDGFGLRMVALFQTERIFPEDPGILYFGRIADRCLVKRREITEVPMRKTSDPEKLYFRFSVAEWKQLRKRIRPDEIGFVHAMTNRFLLERADYISELLLRSEEEYRFYTELKRQVGAALIHGREYGSVIRTEHHEVGFSDGNILLRREGRELLHCTAMEFAGHPGKTFARFRSIMGEDVSVREIRDHL